VKAGNVANVCENISNQLAENVEAYIEAGSAMAYVMKMKRRRNIG
jgi:hypothetical protein